MSDTDTVQYLKNLYPQFQIGSGSYGGLQIFAWGDDTKISIGAYCSFGPECRALLGGEHRMDWVTTYPFPALNDWPAAHGIPGHPATRGDIVIGNDVWCGAETLILSGATVPTGCVIGARSVVTHAAKLTPYCIAAGNPIRIVSHRLPDPDARRMMLTIAWWDWPKARIEAALPLLLQPDVEKFFLAHSRRQI